MPSIKIVLRQAKQMDLKEMSQINNKCLTENYPYEFWLETFTENKNFCFVAVVSAKVIAYILSTKEAVYSLAVLPEFRTCGIGSNLLKLSLNAMTDHNNNSLCTLHTKVSNIAAQNLYKKHDFKITKVLPGYYDPSATRVSKVPDTVDKTKDSMAVTDTTVKDGHSVKDNAAKDFINGKSIKEDIKDIKTDITADTDAYELVRHNTVKFKDICLKLKFKKIKATVL